LRLPTLSTVGKCGRSKRGPTDGAGGRKEDAGADVGGIDDRVGLSAQCKHRRFGEDEGPERSFPEAPDGPDEEQNQHNDRVAQESCAIGIRARALASRSVAIGVEPDQRRNRDARK
jgi:hypothetical protein